MVPVFWTGLAMWLLFAVAPLRALLGLVPRRRRCVGHCTSRWPGADTRRHRAETAWHAPQH